jgi:putative endonuclease
LNWKEAEENAARYLKKKGYRIIDRNYRTRFGEIDIIARYGEYLVFVEVKSGKSEYFP